MKKGPIVFFVALFMVTAIVVCGKTSSGADDKIIIDLPELEFTRYSAEIPEIPSIPLNAGLDEKEVTLLVTLKPDTPGIRASVIFKSKNPGIVEVVRYDTNTSVLTLRGVDVGTTTVWGEINEKTFIIREVTAFEFVEFLGFVTTLEPILVRDDETGELVEKNVLLNPLWERYNGTVNVSGCEKGSLSESGIFDTKIMGEGYQRGKFEAIFGIKTNPEGAYAGRVEADVRFLCNSLSFSKEQSGPHLLYDPSPWLEGEGGVRNQLRQQIAKPGDLGWTKTTNPDKNEVSGVWAATYHELKLWNVPFSPGRDRGALRVDIYMAIDPFWAEPFSLTQYTERRVENVYVYMSDFKLIKEE